MPTSTTAPEVNSLSSLFAAASAHMHPKNELENNPRMLEIERQMAEAGLGPSKSKPTKLMPQRPISPFQNGRHHDALSNISVVSGNNRNSGKISNERRLESMTDRDQELVFRVHLRQLESSVVYKDDYYNAVMKKKQKLGASNVFGDLASTVKSIRTRTRERGREGPGTRTRRSRKSQQPGDSPLASSPPHQEHKIKALANALGTVQTWNPRAPRRVMDFAKLGRDGRDDEDMPTTLLRDDVGVHVRQEIERGYDVIASIHDICRGESTDSIESQIHTLLATLHLEERHEEDFGDDIVSPRMSQFFASLVIAEKGRHYLETVIDLLDLPERARLMPALFENLGALIFVLGKKSEEKNNSVGESQLLKRMLKTVQDTEVSGVDVLAMLESLITSHIEHRDAVLTTLRSEVGAKLVFVTMQRVLRTVFKNEIQEDDVLRSSVGQFATMLVGCLPDIFKDAESSKRVWEVTASVDGLLDEDSKMQYRSSLSLLLGKGMVPPPPER